MPDPLVSVIVPTHARPAALAQCLASLAAQRFPQGQYEVIVVDDGSPASDAARVVACCAEHGARLLVQSHAGPAQARNHGAAHARGQLLAFTDDDCEPAPDWLAVLTTALAAHPGAAVGGRTLNRLTHNPYASASQALVNFIYDYYNRDPCQSVLLTTNNLALPADAFHALGGFVPDLPFSAAEDRDLCDRWRFHGRALVFVPCALVDHAHHLGPVAFLDQHFRYGRGAALCRLARLARGQPPVPVEPPAFYLGLMRAIVRAMPPRRAWLGALLAVASQFAYVLGFLWQQRRRALAPARSDQALSVSN